MFSRSLIVACLIAMASPLSAFAYTGKITFKGNCAVSNTGSCTIGVTGIDGSAKIYASTEMNGHYGAVTNAFTAPANKRIANSENNVCFYARAVDSSSRTRIICLAK